MSKHTPGPWHVGAEFGVDELRPRILILRSVAYVEGASPTTYIIGEVGYPTAIGNTVGAAERKANARLIAAAPETAAERDRLKEINAELLFKLISAANYIKNLGGDDKPYLGSINKAKGVTP